jgi:hypothetical protein
MGGLGRRRYAATQRLDDTHDLRAFRAMADLTDHLSLLTYLLQTGAVQNGHMKKGIRGAIDGRHESKALRGIKPLQAGPNRYITFGIEFMPKPRQTN